MVVVQRLEDKTIHNKGLVKVDVHNSILAAIQAVDHKDL